MNATNRAIMSLLALAWIGVLAGALVLVWDQSLNLNFEESYATFNADIFANTQAEQVLASIALGALMLPALMLLLIEMKPSGQRHEDAASSKREAALEARVDALQKQLDTESRRTGAVLPTGAVSYKDRDEATSHRGWRFLPGRH